MQERMKELEPNENETYKLLGCQQVWKNSDSNGAENNKTCLRRVIWQKSGKSNQL